MKKILIWVVALLGVGGAIVFFSQTYNFGRYIDRQDNVGSMADTTSTTELQVKQESKEIAGSILRQYFPKSNTPYRFSVRIDELVQMNSMRTYNVTLVQQFTEGTVKNINVPMTIVSNIESLDIGVRYQLNLKHDLDKNAYVVTDVIIRPIYD